MRKLSKILAVVLCVVLLCGTIATLVSADTEIQFPEYTAPEAATVITGHSTDFEEGSAVPGQFGAGGGFIGTKTTVGNNTYYQLTNVNEDGSLATHSERKMANLGSPYMVMGKYDYITWSFDIMADRYTNGTDIKTIEEYNALDDKTGYYPSFATTRFTLEAMGIVGYGDTSFLWIKQIDGDWYVCTSNGALKYALPTEAGVWTNITYAITYDANVTYTDGEGTKNVTFAQYEALSDEQKAETTDVTITVNSTLDIYVNGEFAFNIAAANKTAATYTYADFTKQGNQFKYNQLQYGTSSSSRALSPVSFCLDNVTLATYADGYNGDLATALANNTSLLDTNDAIFNQNYNKTKSVAATVTTAEGTYGYMTVEQAFNAAKDGDVIEILADNAATLTLGADSDVTKLTVKTNGKTFNKVVDTKYEVTESAGTYTIQIPKYLTPAYVGPTATALAGPITDASPSAFAGDNGFTAGTANDANGNFYSYITNIGEDGTYTAATARKAGTLTSLYKSLGTSDFAFISFDFMTDMYTNGTTSITIDAYNALSEVEKAAYYPAYGQYRFYQEWTHGDYANDDNLYVRLINGKYVLANDGALATYPLPTEAGVWTNITYAIHSDIEAVEGGYYVNTFDCDIYVNGEYAFALTGWGDAIEGKTITAAPQYKYTQIQGAANGSNYHNDSSSRVSTPTSIAIDNFALYTYADGYTGDVATAIKNDTSLNNCADSYFNNAYNKTNSPYVVGVINSGDDQGYKFTNVQSAMNYAKNGATVELLGNTYYSFEINGLKNFTVITNGYSFSYTETDPPYIVNEVSSGVYTFEAPKYVTPEYVGPTGPATLWNTNFETGVTANGFGASNGSGASMNILDANGNKYGQITNWVDGAMVAGAARQYGSMHAKYGEVAYGDYFTYSFDIMADKYTDGTNLITIEEYEELTDEAKAAYTPSYATTYYYMEAPYLSASIQTPWLKKIDGKWYFCSTSASASNLSEAALLPTEAGVWTNITMAFKIDANVRYTDANGTQTVSYAAYQAISDKSGHTAATVVVNSDFVVYVNGEYAFDYAAFDASNKEIAYATFQSGNNRTFRYMQMQAGSSSSSRVTTPMSICYDNLQCVRYPDGYNGSFATAFNNRTALHTADSVFNATYNLTGTFTAAVYNGDNMGATYYAQESAYALVENGDTIELFANTNAVYTPVVEVTYIKTNGYNFNVELPEGYTKYETAEKGTYVVKVAGPEDMVEVDWVVGGEVYATTTETIGSTPAGPDIAPVKVHPWVKQVVTGWANEEDSNVVLAGGKNTFTAVTTYEADVEILTNITTTQAMVTNTYVPALTDEERAALSDIYFAQGKSEVPEDASGNKFGSRSNVTIGGEAYFKFSETMRIIYNEENRAAVLSFTYEGVTLSVSFICDARQYFSNVLSSNEFSQVEKELVYSALVYADAVCRNANGGSTNFSALVTEYTEYKTQKSTLDEIKASAVKNTANVTAITGYGLSVTDGYAARFYFTLDTAVVGEEFTKAGITLSYTSLTGAEKSVSGYSYKAETGFVDINYDVAIYDVRQTFTVTIGEEVGTFNLASYIVELINADYAEDSQEMQIALAMYNYSECSEAYKRS